MKLTRFFFTSTDLDDLERLELDLERAGVVTPQIHVLTLDDSGADGHRNLHQVSDLMKKDIVHSTLVGSGIGIVAAALVLLAAAGLGWTATAAGWLPWIFLAIIVFGFCSWEGGLWGIQNPNLQFHRFEQLIRDGRHLFFVDLPPADKRLLDEALTKHPDVRPEGTGHAAPGWFIFGQHRFRKIFVETLP